jgi:hypothetical protein
MREILLLLKNSTHRYRRLNGAVLETSFQAHLRIEEHCLPALNKSLQHLPELLSQLIGEFGVLMLAQQLKMVKLRRCQLLDRSNEKIGCTARRKTALARR